MSHLFDSGFSVRKPAWHELTKVLDKSPRSWAEARKQAGIAGWDVEEGPVYGYELAGVGGERVFDPRAVILDDATTRKLASDVRAAIIAGKIEDALTLLGATRIEEKKRTLRSDSGATFGVPTTEYEVIDNKEIGEIVEALTKALSVDGKKAKVVYEALVSLEGGKSIVATLYLDEPITLPGDSSQTFPLLVVSARHDGTAGVRAQATSIRVICANTRAMSDNQADAAGTAFTFRHGVKWRDRVDEAVETIRGLKVSFAENMDFLATLGKTKLTRQQEQDWLDQFLPYPLSAVEVTDRRMRNIDDARGTVKNILESDTCSSVRGTWLAPLFAGDEFLDYYRNVTADGQLRAPQVATQRSLGLVREPGTPKLRSAQIIRELAGVN